LVRSENAETRKAGLIVQKYARNMSSPTSGLNYIN